MAPVIKHKHILRSLSHCDVSSNELFYHTPWLMKYTNQYNSLFGTNNIDSTNDTWIKELVLNKIIPFIRDTELAGSGTVFMVGGSEAMYVEMLVVMGSYGVLMYLDLQSFYLQGFQGYKLSLLFDSVIQNNTQNTQDFFESLVKIGRTCKTSYVLEMSIHEC